MKKSIFKRIAVILSVILLVCTLFTLTACGDDECEHEWGEWSETVPATCAGPGERQRKCPECEEIQTEAIEALAHPYDTKNIVWTWSGYDFATATVVCTADSSHTEKINATVSDTVTVAPSCTAAGTRTYTATINLDGATYSTTKSGTVAAIGHREVADAAVAATCSSTGLTAGSHCSVCGAVVLARQEVPKLNHTQVKIEAIPATCVSDGATEGAKCYVCNEILVVPQPIAKLGHTEQILPGAAATCENTGLTEGKKCSTCGTVTVPQETIEKKNHTAQTLPATAPTCYATGLTEGVKCSSCNEILVAQTTIPEIDCNYVAAVTAPTCETQGYTTHTCSACGDSYVDSYVDALGHDWRVDGNGWVWNGYESAEVCFVCASNPAHLSENNVSASKKIISPTVTDDGYTLYTATVYLDGKAYSDSKTTDYVSLSEMWSNAIYEAGNISNGTVLEFYSDYTADGVKYYSFSQKFMLANHCLKFDFYAGGTYEEYYTYENGDLIIYECSDGAWSKRICTDPGYAANALQNGFGKSELLLAVNELYSELEYDSETNTFSIAEAVILEENYIDCSIKFENNLISEFRATRVYSDGSTRSIIMQYSDIGATSVTLPHVHSWGDWSVETRVSCSSNGLKKRSCACGEEETEIIYSEGHSYSSTVVSPTCETQGYTTHICSNCGDNYTDSYTSALGHAWGAWSVSGESTVRGCTNDCNCGKQQKIISINATYNGIRLLTGETVSRDDVAVTAMLLDGTTLSVTDFTLENDVMTVDGSNYVDVIVGNMSTKVVVPAIYDNLPGATSEVEFTYTVKNDVVTITGFIGDSTDIVIPNHIDRVPVRAIANSAFSGKQIESLVINDGITSIGNYSFENCIRLEDITFGNGLKTIGYSAFSGCISLNELYIPNNVTSIGVRSSGDGAFQGCTALKKVTIGDLSTDVVYVTIHSRTFMDCTSLTEIFIGNRVKDVGESAFAGCTSLKTLTIGDNVETIGNNAFARCESLISLVIPDKVTIIGNGAFEECTRLEDVNFGDSLETIGYSAFYKCVSLTEIDIPYHVLEIGVRSSGNGAFQDCTALERVTIGDLSTDAVYATIHARAFMGCTSLSEVFIGSRVKEIGEQAFEKCISLQTFTTGISVKTIGYAAFRECENLLSVTLTDSVTSIGTEAFDECEKLSYVSFGAGLQSIGNYAFYKCENLGAAIFNSNITSIGNHAFANCSLLKTLSIPFGETVIGSYAFSECTYLSDVDLGTSVKEIGSYAFTRCEILYSVKIPSSVTYISSGAFDECTGLSTVIVEKGNELLRSFGAVVFSECPSINRIYYTGTATDWALIEISDNNDYPLNVAPYFYSANQPDDSDNYWHYNKDGEIRVWGVSEIVFKAQEYSDNFVEIFGDESSSYATTFYNDLKNDAKLMAGITAWEAIHITEDPSYIFDPNNGLISKKDLYKFTLYDIITGEKAETESFDYYDESSKKFILYVGNMLLGGSGDMISDMDLIYSALSTTDASDLAPILNKILSEDEIKIIGGFIDIAENAYDALKSVSQYVALRQVKNGYVEVLLSIYNDKDNSKELRDAAKELADCYRDACNKTLSEFQRQTFANASNRDIFSWAINNAVDILAECDPTGILKAVGFTGKAIRAIAAPLKLDEFCQAYYQLRTSVAVEAALRKLIQAPLADYMRVENSDDAENYMYAIEMYKNSVLYGFDYSIEFLTAYMNSSTPDSDEIATYKDLVEELKTFKANKIDMYKTFDDTVLKLYEYYCS